MEKKIFFLLLIALSLQYNGIGQSFTRNDHDIPKYVPKFKADAYLELKLKQKKGGVELRWKTDESLDNKSIVLLKGVVSENEQIKWQILEKYESKPDINKYEYWDTDNAFQKAYYRLRVSEDGDNVEYTKYYLIQKN